MDFIYHLFLGRFALSFSLVFMLCDYPYQSCSEIGLAAYMSPFILLLLACHVFFFFFSFNTCFWTNRNEKHFYSILRKSTKSTINIMSLQSFSLYLIHSFCLGDILLLCLNTDFKRGLDTQTLLNLYTLNFSHHTEKLHWHQKEKLWTVTDTLCYFFFQTCILPLCFYGGIFHLAIPRAWWIWSLQNKILKIILCYYVKSS